jgi:TctA family transporter
LAYCARVVIGPTCARELAWSRAAAGLAAQSHGEANGIGTDLRVSPSDAIFANAVAGTDWCRRICRPAPPGAMALLLGALTIQGITPGPQLISEHPDIF